MIYAKIYRSKILNLVFPWIYFREYAMYIYKFQATFDLQKLLIRRIFNETFQGIESFIILFIVFATRILQGFFMFNIFFRF